MTTTTDALRAVLARLDGDLTHRDRLRLHLADTGEDDRGAWNSPLMQDALGEMDDMYAALAQALAALDAQPPPADAALVAERDLLLAVYLTAAAVWAASADECGIEHDTDEMDALAGALTDYEQAATRAAKETPCPT